MHLITEAKKAYKMFSVQIAMLAIIWGSMPIEWQAGILEWFGVSPERMPAAFGIAFIISRLIAQPSVKSE